MSQIEPRWRCARCKRGVLNRRIETCLYCGQRLPAGAFAAPDAMSGAARDQERGQDGPGFAAPACSRSAELAALHGLIDSGVALFHQLLD